MEIVISYAFAHIVEAIILWMSMSQMYERRYKNWITGLIMLSGHAVMFGVFLTDNIYVVTTVNNVVYFLLIAWLFNISKKVAVFWALIYNAMMALSELTVFYIIQYLVGVCDVKGNGVVTNIIVVCLCKTIFFLFIQVMVLIKNRSNVGKDLYKDDLPIVLFIVSLISSLMVFITYYVVGMNSLISQTEAVCMVMSMIILILADILVLFVNIKVNERNAENAMIKIQLEKERADARYYKLEYEKNESLEILRHDMNNHLVLCQDLVQVKMRNFSPILTCQKLSLSVRSFIHSFEFVWRHIVAMAMNSFRIVESFQIFKNQLVCLLIITDFKAIEPFTFDNRMKGFNACIIPRKSFLRITALHIFGCFFIFLCNILAATIRMDN